MKKNFWYYLKEEIRKTTFWDIFWGYLVVWLFLVWVNNREYNILLWSKKEIINYVWSMPWSLFCIKLYIAYNNYRQWKKRKNTHS